MTLAEYIAQDRGPGPGHAKLKFAYEKHLLTQLAATLRESCMLFEVAIIEKPTKLEEEQGKTERLVLGPTAVCARDKEAAIVAATQQATLGAVDPARLQVLVRPFI